MRSASTLASKIEELRGGFDRERAAPLSARTEEQMENLLAIRVSKDPYAVRVSEICGLTTVRKIVGLPSPVAELLGVAGVRGTIVPVYDLAALLGYSSETDEPRWLVLCGTDELIALAFRDFESYLRVPQEQIYRAEQGNVGRTHVTHVATGAGAGRALVSIPLLRATIQERCRGGVSKER